LPHNSINNFYCTSNRVSFVTSRLFPSTRNAQFIAPTQKEFFSTHSREGFLFSIYLNSCVQMKYGINDIANPIVAMPWAFVTVAFQKENFRKIKLKRVENLMTSSLVIGCSSTRSEEKIFSNDGNTL
jgi:hypothetical protein